MEVVNAAEDLHDSNSNIEADIIEREVGSLPCQNVELLSEPLADEPTLIPGKSLSLPKGFVLCLNILANLAEGRLYLVFQL